MSDPPRQDGRRYKIAAAVGLLAFLGVWLTIDHPGLTWDEPYHITAALEYMEWVADFPRSALSPEATAEAWHHNRDHPPLVKLMMGTAVMLSEGLAWVRLPGALLYGGLAAAVFLFMARHFGTAAGLFSAASLAVMPRVFGHAHLLTFDVPVAFFWFVTAALAARGLREGGWAALAGLVFGLGLLTKINAVFIPLPVLAWAVAVAPRKAWKLVVSILLLGPVVFLIGWPWLWHDPGPRLREYFARQTARIQGGTQTRAPRYVVPSYYGGRVYDARTGYAPWHYPVVMTAATTPPLVLAAAACGALVLAGTLARGRKKPSPAPEEVPTRKAVGVLLAANAAFILLLASAPGVPRYDGVRLFMPLFPFLACLAGLGFLWVARKVGRWTRRRWPGPALAAVLLAASAVPLVLGHPFALSYYSVLVGGLPGAEQLGFETTFWCDSLTRDVYRRLEERLSPGGRVAFSVAPENVFRMGWDLKKIDEDPPLVEGREPSRRGVPYPTATRVEYVVLVPRKSMFRQNLPAAALYELRHLAVREAGVYRNGVPLCLVFRAEDLAAAAAAAAKGK
jgi:4-amino-4-deoxy-L-arabinose transferase-like glycosyltransferase